MIPSRESVPKEEKRVARVTTEKSLVSIDITLMNDKELRATRTVKPPSETSHDQWMTQKVFTGPPPKVASQTRTQKRRLQRARSIQGHVAYADRG